MNHLRAQGRWEDMQIERVRGRSNTSSDGGGPALPSSAPAPAKPLPRARRVALRGPALVAGGSSDRLATAAPSAFSTRGRSVRSTTSESDSSVPHRGGEGGNVGTSATVLAGRRFGDGHASVVGHERDAAARRRARRGRGGGRHARLTNSRGAARVVLRGRHATMTGRLSELRVFDETSLRRHRRTTRDGADLLNREKSASPIETHGKTHSGSEAHATLTRVRSGRVAPLVDPRVDVR